MKKIALVLFMILALSGVALADSWHDQYNYYDNTYNTTNQGGQGGLGGQGGNAYQKQQIKDSGNSTNLIGNGIGNFSPSAKVGDITNISQPVQVFEPSITFEAPKIPKTVAVETPPQVSPMVEVNFIPPKEGDATKLFPKFGPWRGLETSDTILEELYVKEDVTYAGLYAAGIKGAKDKKVTSMPVSNVVVQIWGQDSAKTNQVGVSGGVNASGVVQTTGIGVGLGLGYTSARSTSRSFYTVKYLLIQTPEKERKANIKRYEEDHAQATTGTPVVLYDASSSK